MKIARILRPKPIWINTTQIPLAYAREGLEGVNLGRVKSARLTTTLIESGMNYGKFPFEYNLHNSGAKFHNIPLQGIISLMLDDLPPEAFEAPHQKCALKEEYYSNVISPHPSGAIEIKCVWDGKKSWGNATPSRITQSSRLTHSALPYEKSIQMYIDRVEELASQHL